MWKMITKESTRNENKWIDFFLKSKSHNKKKKQMNGIDDDDVKLYTILLDIDETLLHSFFINKLKPPQIEHLNQRMSDEIHLPFEQRNFHYIFVGQDEYVFAVLRPGMWKFLRTLSQQYNIGIWSAAGSLYVKNMCKFLFPEEAIQPIIQLSWEDCTVDLMHVYSKPLHTPSQRLNQPIDNLILVDNRKENGHHFPDHFVSVKDWCPEWNKEETELQKWTEKESYLRLVSSVYIPSAIKNVLELKNDVELQNIWASLDKILKGM